MAHQPGHFGNIDDEAVTVRIAAEPSYSSERRDDWRRVRIMTKDAFGFPTVADLDTRVRMGADRFRGVNGTWPSAFELFNDRDYQRSIQTLADGFVGLPIRFRTDDGRIWLNNPISGPREQTGDLIDKIAFGLRPDNFPTIPLADMPQILAFLSPIKQPSRGGGGGGGAGRAPVVFDRAELTEGATERWRGMLLEEPDEAAISGLISDYMKDANAFWMKEAGRRDFDTFVVDRIRQQTRYGYLYSKKPGFQSETEYLGGFRQVAGGLGLNASATLREVEAGASTGVGLAGFGERLSGIREVRTANAGAFSQRIAASAGQMGLTRT